MNHRAINNNAHPMNDFLLMVSSSIFSIKTPMKHFLLPCIIFDFFAGNHLYFQAFDRGFILDPPNVYLFIDL